MTRELAEKIVVALAPLRDAAPFAVAREALTLAAAFDAAWRIESAKPAPSPSLADGDWRDAAKPAAPSRPEWVRITGPKDAVSVTVGKAYRVVDWTGDVPPLPTILNDNGDKWCCEIGSDVSRSFPSWEPCAAPSPAASPAPYVPKVGDVVESGTKGHLRVVIEVDADGYIRLFDLMGHYGRIGGVYDPRLYTYLRPATAAERAAAGLDAPTPKPVDREGLIAAMDEAARIWLNDSSDKRRTVEVHTDAALAFMAKGGAK